MVECRSRIPFMDDIEGLTFDEKFSFDFSTAFNEVYFQ